jgi:hypothetical protein
MGEKENADDVDDLLQELGKPDEEKSTGLLIDLHKSSESSDPTNDNSGINEIIKKDNGDVMSDEKKGTTAVVESDERIDGYDPDENFKTILMDAGLKRGIKAITESFFNGEIDNPAWLNYVLMEAGIGKKHRNLILMSYYGAPPSELGISDDIANSSHYRPSSGKNGGASDKSSADFAEAELRKYETANLESIKRELAMKKMKKESLHLDEELDNIGKKKEPDDKVKTRTVQRPIFDGNGHIRKDDEGRIIAERVTEPIDNNQSSNDPFMMMSTMLQLLDNRKQTEQTSDPAIAELKNMVTNLTIQQKEATLQANIERLQAENDNIERTYRDNLKRAEDDARDRINREHEEHMRQLEDMKRSFDDKIEQRDQMGQLIGAYEKKVDDMKSEMREHQSTVKDSVVKQASTTADKVTTQMGEVIENAMGPVSEMMQQQYTTNLELFRQQHGLSGSIVPHTSEKELADYVEDE